MIKNRCMSILLYGDSISKGIIYNKEKNKYEKTEKNFAHIISEKINCVIENAGRFGNTVNKAIKKFPKLLSDKNPDIVVLEFGGNDCDFNWEEIASDPNKIYKPNTEFEVFENTLKEMVTEVRKNKKIPVLFNLPPIDSDRYFKWIGRGNSTAYDNILKWLGTVNKIYWWQERYNSMILKVATDTNTKLIDIRSSFLIQPDYRNFLCEDGIHPNDEGHKLIAEAIQDYIQKKYSFLLEKIA